MLPDQLQTYLSYLGQYPALQRLADCDPYDEQRFSVEESVELREDLRRFTVDVKNRSVPEVPDHVGDSPGEIADGQFGWKGIEAFCDQLQCVLKDGITADVGIVSIGD